MLTEAEWQELYSNTTVTRTTQNGVNGRLFTASNGSSLFLPAAGCRWYGELDLAGSIGDYWSSSLFTASPIRAWCFDFDSSDPRYHDDDRNYGYSVRAVREN